MSSSLFIKENTCKSNEDREANSGKVKYLDQKGLLLKLCFGYMAATVKVKWPDENQGV